MRRSALVDRDVAEEIEEFVRRGGATSSTELEQLGAHLARSGPVGSHLGSVLAPWQAVVGSGPVSATRQIDVEALVYPRLWRIIEAVRDDLPVGEIENRVRGLEVRLTELLDRPDPG